jgi:hypothetical protein
MVAVDQAIVAAAFAVVGRPVMSGHIEVAPAVAGLRFLTHVCHPIRLLGSSARGLGCWDANRNQGSGRPRLGV